VLRAAILVFTFYFVGQCSLSYAHEVSTHANITRRAIEYLAQQKPALAGVKLLADDLVFGSVHEDDTPRFFFHFLPGLATTTASCNSLEWGFLDELCTAQAFGLEITIQNIHQWQDAIAHASSGQGFKELGYVLHLLEDLGSPAHTRIDPHPPGNSDPFEKHNENRCATPRECMPIDDLIISLGPNPQKFFIDLRDFTATNFFSKNTIKTDIFVPSSPCDFLRGDPQPCGPTAVTEDENYFYDGRGRKIAYKGRFGPTINERVANEQFDELAPQIVRYVASLINFYIETANLSLPEPPPEPQLQTFTDPVAFQAALTSQTTITFDNLASGTSIPSGTTINGVTYTFNAAGFAGLATHVFLSVSPPNTLGVSRGLGVDGDFFLAGNSVTLTFAQPINAIGAYFSSNLVAGTAQEFIFISTPSGTAFSGDALPEGTFGFPANALRFVGLVSDTPFSQATLAITNPSPENVGFVADNIIIGR
jgi:hypothetical protein